MSQTRVLNEIGMNLFWYSQSSVNELNTSCEWGGHELDGTRI